MKGFILAAGLGTRLRPLTINHAKPSLLVAGVPVFWFGAWHMAKNLGISDIAINIGHAANSLRIAATDIDLCATTGINFVISDESSEILGSSGGLWKIKEWIGKDTVAVINGDCISKTDWKRLLKQHQKSKGLMTLMLRKHSNSKEEYTNVEVDSYGRVLGFGPKTRSGVMFTGAYILDPQALERLPSGKSDLMTALLRPLSEERQLHATVDDSPWFDIGSVPTYAHTAFDFLNQIPEFKTLVDIKMQEPKPGVLIPKCWAVEKIKCKLIAPVALSGSEAQWQATLSREDLTIGPRVIALSAPQKITETNTSNKIYFNDSNTSI